MYRKLGNLRRALYRKLPNLRRNVMYRKLPNLRRACLLYTSDAADERSSVDLGGRRIITKKKTNTTDAPVRHELHEPNQ